MRKIRYPFGPAAAALLLTAALLFGGILDYSARCTRVREGVVRLHVTANSDSTADQTVKLQVRDAVLAESEAVLAGAKTAAEAARMLEQALPRLEAAAQAVLARQCLAYTAQASMETAYFDTRTYLDVTLPAGRYPAVKIRLGEGAGQNWWCVMFPPLCLPAAQPAEGVSAFGEAGAGVVDGDEGYRIRFRLVEAAEWLWEKLRA